jgi:hypothetical protein
MVPLRCCAPTGIVLIKLIAIAIRYSEYMRTRITPASDFVGFVPEMVTGLAEHYAENVNTMLQND